MTAESSSSTDANDAGGKKPTPPATNAPEGGADRREFLHTASASSMAFGLAASYGTFATLGGRFVYPSGGRPVAWQFVSRLADMAKGDAVNFTAPDGAKIVIARLGSGETTQDFIALSSVCPHLGCKVHWELANDRFFCPCHNGAFDAEGKPTEGPPAADGRALAQYPLEISDGLSGEQWQEYVTQLMRADGVIAEDAEPTAEQISLYDQEHDIRRESDAKLFIEVPTEGLSRDQAAVDSALGPQTASADRQAANSQSGQAANSQSREV